ncbi:MAG: aspartate/glutamate racemase family protein [Pseudomonadota bacterium]
MIERKIHYQLVAPLAATIGPEEPVRRQAFLNRHAAPGTLVQVVSAAAARGSIEGDWDATIAGPSIVEGILGAEADGFDAAIVGCFSDPSLGAVREAVSIPVVGPGTSSILMALQVGERISVLTPGDNAGGRTRSFFRALGLEDRLASARGVGLSVVEMAEAAKAGTIGAHLKSVATAARRAVDDDGAEVLVLGCMSMAFLDPTEVIGAEVGVPVVNPVIAALKAAEAQLAMGLSHSRRRWPRANPRPVIQLASRNAETEEAI